MKKQLLKMALIAVLSCLSLQVLAQDKTPVITIETALTKNSSASIALIGVTTNLEIDYGNGTLTPIKVSDEVPTELAEVKKFNFNATADNPVIKIYGEGVKLLYFKYPCKIKAIDLSNAKDLEVLDIDNANFTDLKLDVSHCPKLNTLMVYGNMGLKSLDLSKNPLLKNVQVQYTKIEDLDLSHLTQLETLYAFNSSVKALDVSNSPNMKELVAYETPQLGLVNVAGCSKLEKLWAHTAAISTLTLNGNNGLTDVQIESNPNLDHADFAQAPNMQTLLAGQCAFKSIDLSNCSKLDTVELFGNNLSHLKIAQGSVLGKFFIFGNQLSACTLDSIYTALGKAPHVGTYIVARAGDNSNPDLEKSKTQIATGKGYKVIDGLSNEEITGDGSGCTQGAVENIVGDGFVTLSPTPSPGIVHIDSKTLEVANITIYNMNGQQVAQFENPGKSIDLSFLTNARYIALVKLSNGKYYTASILLNK